MTPSAPRYHPAVRAAVERLDDDSRPVAAVWRDVAVLADDLGLTRPSYTHVRRLVLVGRGLRSARRQVRELLREGASRASSYR